MPQHQRRRVIEPFESHFQNKVIFTNPQFSEISPPVHESENSIQNQLIPNTLIPILYLSQPPTSMVQIRTISRGITPIKAKWSPPDSWFPDYIM